jgi:hypothetical protein
MYKQRTRFFQRFTGVTMTASSATTIGMITGLRGASAVLVKVWGGSAAGPHLASASLTASWNGVTASTSASAIGHWVIPIGTSTLAATGACNGTEADPQAWLFLLPQTTVDGAGATTAYGVAVGCMIGSAQLKLTADATAGGPATGCTVDVWIFDQDAGASATDTFMVP